MDIKNLRKRIIFSTILALTCVVMTLIIPVMVTNDIQKKFVRHGYPVVFVDQDISAYDYPPLPHAFAFNSPWQNPTDINLIAFGANIFFFFFVAFGILCLFTPQKFNHLKASKVFALILVVFLALRFYQTQFRHEAHMHFPLTSSGTFIEQPHLVVVGGVEKVRWVLPGVCVNNAHVAVTSDYVEDVDATVWMGGDANCVQEGGDRSVCTTPLNSRLTDAIEYSAESMDSQKIRGLLSAWVVVTGFDCSWGEKHISSIPLVIKPRIIQTIDQNL